MELLVFVFYLLSLVIFWGTVALAGLLFLRVILKWMDVNPYGRVPYHLTRLTEPMVRPLRAQFGRGILRFDMVPLLMGVMILVTGLFISNMIAQLGSIIGAIGYNILLGTVIMPRMIGEFIKLAGLLYVIAIFLRFFLPFFGVGYSNKFFHFLYVITEPLLKPLRRFFVAGRFDFSPVIAMFLIQLLTSILASAVAGIG
ncbi:MAG TPA: YggT family protein [Blastocatellia bacterium]